MAGNKKEEMNKIDKDILAISALETFSNEEKSELMKWLLAKKQTTKKNSTEKISHESKETEKIPEFEEHTLHVESSWPERQLIEINPYEKGGEKIKVKAKVNQEGDVEVIEYIDWPEIGEQIFITYESFVKYACAYKWCSQEILEQRYLPTEEKLKMLAGNPGKESEHYQNFHNTHIKWKKLPGYYIPRGTKIGRKGSYLMVWLAGGKKDATFKEEMRESEWDSRSYGFSGWLFK